MQQGATDDEILRHVHIGRGSLRWNVGQQGDPIAHPYRTTGGVPMNDHPIHPRTVDTPAFDRTFADAVSDDVKRRATEEQEALLTADPVRWLAGLHDILANLRRQEEKYVREIAVLQALTADGIEVPAERLEALETQRHRRDAFRANVLRRLPDVEALIAGPGIEPFLLAVPAPPSAGPAPTRLDVAAPLRGQRRTSGAVWAAVFESARAVPGEFVLVDIPLSRSSVIQLASDIRNAHRRSRPKPRLATLRREERWEARWGTHDGEYKVWVKYCGLADDSEARSA